MPLYEFDIIGPRGNIIGHTQQILSVAERDNPFAPNGETLRRRQVPSRLGVVGARSSQEERVNRDTLGLLHRMEERQGNTSDFYRRLEYSPETLKSVYGHNAPKLAEPED